MWNLEHKQCQVALAVLALPGPAAVAAWRRHDEGEEENEERLLQA